MLFQTNCWCLHFFIATCVYWKYRWYYISSIGAASTTCFHDCNSQHWMLFWFLCTIIFAIALDWHHHQKRCTLKIFHCLHKFVSQNCSYPTNLYLVKISSIHNYFSYEIHPFSSFIFIQYPIRTLILFL